ncbi:hypothetical protein BOX15_Mlig024247g2 [Macrostomum lignano]|uniref:TLC domain-containing protein n=2 Tax=Macrostomum lignano TaxID=282301 RepID=A0A1I8I5B8_9PLAT|nr:hypothetical protein BOX15_Mlig024247g2 [Macrostomum lignano]
MAIVFDGYSRVYPASYYEDPSLTEFFHRIGLSLGEFAFNSTKYPHDYAFTLRMLRSWRLVDVGGAVLLAVLFTALRYVISVCFSLPVANWLQIQPASKLKWPESIWKFIAYSGLWLYSLYVVLLSGRYDFFHNPVDILRGIIFDENYLEKPLPSDIYWMYALQLGFYLHSVYATLFMDAWRKDSIMMLFHHGLTIFLLEFSLLMKYYKTGALVLFLHDLSDIILEFTKINVYLKDRGKKFFLLNEWLANIGFVIFAFSWAWFRLYWFPLKVLYPSHWSVYLYHQGRDPKMFVFFNSMLFALQILHIYWFYFIVLLLVRVATGTQREVEDTREYEEAERHRRLNGHQESPGVDDASQDGTVDSAATSIRHRTNKD